MVKILFLLIACTSAAKIQRRELQKLDDFSIQTFTTLFREALLAQVATEWNHTLELGKVLHLKMGTCQTQINAEGDQCKACAKSSCGSSNTQAEVVQKVDILSILLNPLKILEGPLSIIGSTLHNVVDILGVGGNTFVKSMASLVNTAGNTLTGGLSTALNGLKSGVDAVGHFFTDTGNTLLGGINTIGHTAENLAGGIKDGFGTLGSTLGSVGQTIGSGLSTVGETIGHGVSSLLDAGKGLLSSIGSLFGKRTLDSQTLQCMQSCAPCRPLLMDKDSMARAICGDDVVNLNNTFNAGVLHLSSVYNATIDKEHTIIQSIEIDQTSTGGDMSFHTVFITAYYKGSYVRYQSDIPYSLMKIPETAQKMAMEYWSQMR
ncbi:hypothetical protein ACJMK2_021754 [Sinanodonta woodiana]|uniref:Uncharacterized protein n=1 Tax=Sinanodonta woodiana TaxID=1069815 RepID=A0ABD3TIU6_SINWO